MDSLPQHMWAAATNVVVAFRLTAYRIVAEGGYAMAALLVGVSVMVVLITVALPVWQTAIRREREAELVFRGEQYVQAINLFQRRYAGTFPPNIDVLVQQRFLRRRYQDPITRGDFRLLYTEIGTGPVNAGKGGPAAAPVSPGRGGIIGVVSTSTDRSLRLYNGRGRYNEWTFVATAATSQAGRAGAGGNEIDIGKDRAGGGGLRPPLRPPARVPPLPRR